MADPTKKRLITDSEIKEIQNYASLGATMEDMAAILGICKRTLERRVNDQEAVAVALKKGRGLANVKMAQSLFHAGTKKGNVTAMIFWLKSRAGWSDFGDESEIKKEILVKFDRDKKPKKSNAE